MIFIYCTDLKNINKPLSPGQTDKQTNGHFTFIFLNLQAPIVTKCYVRFLLVFHTFCIEIYAKCCKCHCFGSQALTCNQSSYKWNHLHQVRLLSLRFVGRCGLGGLLDPQPPLEVFESWRSSKIKDGIKKRYTNTIWLTRLWFSFSYLTKLL